MIPVKKKPSDVRVLKEGRYLRLLLKEGWEFVARKNCTGIVIIVALTDEREVVLVEQYRKPLGKNVIEFPAGLVNDRGAKRKESIATAAARELFEETGYRAKKITALVDGPSSAGSSGDTISIVRASGLRKVGLGGGDDSEEIEVFTVPLKQVNQWLENKRKAGILVDPKIYAGLYFLNQETR